MTYNNISVLTLVRGRQDHLDHLISGLRCQTRRPDELVIAYMQDRPPVIAEDLPFSVNCVHVGGEPMPLAKARNRAAEEAHGNVLAFLDVDCIPDCEFVRRGAEATSEDDDGVFLPEVRYLPASPQGWMDTEGRFPDFERLESAGTRHPSKPDLGVCATTPISDFGELWGLAFILHAETWNKAGGMDESYIGYGAEETDFSRRLQSSGAHLYWLGGTACYHQHHTVHKPPLQHFKSIVRNAKLFHDRWGNWCMEYWLDDFERRGLIRRSPHELQIMRHPTVIEIADAKQPPDVRFS